MTVISIEKPRCINKLPVVGLREPICRRAHLPYVATNIGASTLTRLVYCAREDDLPKVDDIGQHLTEFSEELGHLVATNKGKVVVPEIEWCLIPMYRIPAFCGVPRKSKTLRGAIPWGHAVGVRVEIVRPPLDNVAAGEGGVEIIAKYRTLNDRGIFIQDMDPAQMIPGPDGILRYVDLEPRLAKEMCSPLYDSQS